ncbi:hypothetical protein C8R41DRAFT_904722 [Lentinula lateritia]|uniref:Secreted protein n=1 Tax=Lentinula lateritia TaxID=40482 RepID=A0ABQ8V7G1_9AGAR|nr:hypothetical protein C8R41DRAFT_904722 [Lentinula lateritia]
MYFHRLLSALAFVSMVLSAAVPSPGSPTADAHQLLALRSNGPQLLSRNEATIEVEFPEDSADPRWTETTQNNANAGVIQLLRHAWKKYGLQDVKLKDVKFHGFVSGTDKRHSFSVKFSEDLPTFVDVGDCGGWVTVAFKNYAGKQEAVVSGSIDSNAGESISSIKSYRFGITDLDKV